QTFLSVSSSPWKMLTGVSEPGGTCFLAGQTGMSVLLCRTRPWPIRRILYQSGLDWITFDILLNPIERIFIPNCMIERFVLPEAFTSSCQYLVTFASGVTLNRLSDSP